MFAIFGLGPMEIALIVVLGVLVFGRKLPDPARYLGKSIAEFRKLRLERSSQQDIPRNDDDDDPGAAGVLARLKPKPPRLDGGAIKGTSHVARA